MPPILPPRRASVAPPETRDALALFGRQVTTLVPATYGGLNAGPDPGTVVGITLGSVGGFILIVYFVYICMSFGTSDSASSYGTASVVTRKSRRSHRRGDGHRHRHGGSRQRETVEIRTSSRGPVVVEEIITPARDHVDRIVVEERRRSVSRPPVVPSAPPVVLSDDDEVVVIEEHSPPRRHRTHRRSSASQRHERHASGFREVDPDRFAAATRP